MSRRQPQFDASDPLLDGPVAERLDLHGFGAEEAVRAARSFLETWQRRGSRLVVHIITGKGKGSVAGPVLKRKIAALLKNLPAVVADWAPDEAGGGFKIRLR
jgi:DNA-nicking Smr family endonuclease